MTDAAAKPPLGIIAGSGRLPQQLIEACQASGRPFFVLAFEGQADMQPLAHVPHAVVRLGAIGESLNILRREKTAELVLAGRVERPSLTELRPDLAGTKLLAKMGKAFFGGDNALFASIVAFLEEEGFKVIGIEDVFSDLIAPEGVLGNVSPSKQDKADIAHGLLVAKQLGELDIGQAVIVENGYVIGVEAAEGTDALISRCAGLKQTARGGVLVKAKKPLQESRVDLPTIGPKTVENAYDAGLVGIAVEAGGSIILDRETMLARADELGIFVVGVTHE